MKTLEEVKTHVNEVGYTDASQLRIAGFLVGVGVKDEHEIIKFRNGGNEFSAFLHWFNDSSTELKAKVYQDDKCFDVTFDEICGNLKKYNPIIVDGIVPDDLLEKIFKEFFGEEEPKYKYVGEEREKLIKYREKIQCTISELKNEYIGSLINNECFSSLIYRAYIDNYTRCLKNIEDKLNETVD